MSLQYDTHSLQLHDDRLLNEKVKAVAPSHLPLVLHLHFNLPLEFDATKCELDLQRPLIDRLKESWAQCSVYCDCGTNHAP